MQVESTRVDLQNSIIPFTRAGDVMSIPMPTTTSGRSVNNTTGRPLYQNSVTPVSTQKFYGISRNFVELHSADAASSSLMPSPEINMLSSMRDASVSRSTFTGIGRDQTNYIGSIGSVGTLNVFQPSAL
ncbi:hypothetical protein VKT23_018984 [Stygiomarasmius scandens]|uniref:Uncharacterized protein n=1 Tax=Marasmiellus scandens TaxID=2682957 RepID=A0ABR1IMU4_9AGAR